MPTPFSVAPNSRVDIDHPDSFKSGVRVLLLMLRAKDGGSAKTDRKAVKKVVTTSPEEFEAELAALRSRWQPNERIYSTINARNIEKAIRIFRYRQLDVDYFATPDRQSFYLDLENRWISCLKDGKASNGSLFLFDIDGDNPQASNIHQELVTRKAGFSTFVLVDDYCTRNGRHVITEPFNPSTISTSARDCLQKNSLMLWSY